MFSLPDTLPNTVAELQQLLIEQQRINQQQAEALGRMISLEQRQHTALIINEAIEAGCGVGKACKEAGIDRRTYRRWTAAGVAQVSADARPEAIRPVPSNRLSDEERARILASCHEPRFADVPPSQIVPVLADEGIYQGSESTYYRVLHEADEQHERGRARPRTAKPLSTHCASGPNELWSWDVTFLGSPTRGIYYYLYMIMDIWSRKNARKHGTTQRVVNDAFQEEKEALGLLPVGDFSDVLSMERRITKDGMVSVDGNLYSVPNGTGRKPLQIERTATELRILDGQLLLAVHPLMLGKNQRQVIQGHRTSTPVVVPVVNASANDTTIERAGDSIASRSLDDYEVIGASLAKGAVR